MCRFRQDFERILGFGCNLLNLNFGSFRFRQILGFGRSLPHTPMREFIVVRGYSQETLSRGSVLRVWVSIFPVFNHPLVFWNNIVSVQNDLFLFVIIRCLKFLLRLALPGLSPLKNIVSHRNSRVSVSFRLFIVSITFSKY